MKTARMDTVTASQPLVVTYASVLGHAYQVARIRLQGCPVADVGNVSRREIAATEISARVTAAKPIGVAPGRRWTYDDIG